MFNQCKHKWELKSKDILPSPYEQFCDGLESFKNGGPWLFKKKIIYVFICEKCGAVRKDEVTSE
jgi:hypothetical protein